MARLGITHQDVIAAIQAIVDSGKNPTIEAIRRRLGTGSSSTIAKHLRAWRAHTQPMSHFEINTASAEEAVVLMQNMWLTLNQHMQEKLGVLEEQHQLKLSGLEEALQRHKHNNQRWQQLLAQWLDEKNKLTTEQKTAKMVIEQLRRQCDQAQLALAAQEEKLLFKEEMIQDLKNELAAIQLKSAQDQRQTRLERTREIKQYQKLMGAVQKIVVSDDPRVASNTKEIYIKHINEKPMASDGYRILIDRDWPKGLRKEKMKIHRWIKEMAPSKDLHRWFSNNPKKWGKFCKQYTEELRNKSSLLKAIRNILKKNHVTLLSSMSTEKQYALILKQALLSSTDASKNN